jgi:hypothetical protein
MLMDARMPRTQASEQRAERQQSPDQPRCLAVRAFQRGDIPAVRRFTKAFGARTGIASARLADFVLAVSEAAACATACGPCTARVRLWVTGGRAFCEVRGDGILLRRTSLYTRPGGRLSEEEAMRRLVLRQLSDYFCVATGPQDGVRVLLSMSVS